ncbi:MAG: 50S ribosomal protein L5 [Bacteroidetes bacterium]|nr:50S ribosomal protein L5 [Bacteroidota bacterium]MCW5896393.1 50S ribosomal protein L5 [Bacteroidota bacterium]
MAEEKSKKGGAPKPEKKKEKGAAAAQASDKAPRSSGKEERVTPRLLTTYRNDVVPALMKRFKYKSVMQVPRLEKISVNIGVGQATQDAKLVDSAARDLESIVGQKVVITKAKKAISNFKLREGMPIGCRVTLRRARMWEFFDRFVAVVVPRMRDFRGLNDRSFDGRGNYTLGLKEHIVFPEIDVDKISKIFGMDITFVTTAKTDQEAYELLKSMGFPFVKRQEVLETQKS